MGVEKGRRDWGLLELTALPEAPVAGQQGLSKSLRTVIPFLVIIMSHPSKGVLHALACVQQLLTHLLMYVIDQRMKGSDMMPSAKLTCFADGCCGPCTSICMIPVEAG